MIRVKFERDRTDVPVSPRCPVWHDQDGRRIPIMHMETQHIVNSMHWLLCRGHKEMAYCSRLHDGAWIAKGNRTGGAEACLLADSVRRLKYMDLWYTRFTEELDRRRANGEEIAEYPARVSKESSGSQTRRSRIVGGADRLRHLLRAPEGST